MPFVVFPDDNGQTAHPVSCGDQVAVVLQKQDGGGALDHLLSEADALGEGAFLVDHGGNQLVGVHSAAGHGFKMSATEGEVLLD